MLELVRWWNVMGHVCMGVGMNSVEIWILVLMMMIRRRVVVLLVEMVETLVIIVWVVAERQRRS